MVHLYDPFSVDSPTASLAYARPHDNKLLDMRSAKLTDTGMNDIFYQLIYADMPSEITSRLPCFTCVLYLSGLTTLTPHWCYMPAEHLLAHHGHFLDYHVPLRPDPLATLTDDGASSEQLLSSLSASDFIATLMDDGAYSEQILFSFLVSDQQEIQ